MRRLRRLGGVFALVALAACAPTPDEPSSDDARTYRVRAEIRRLPVEGRPSPELTVRHEAIDGFIDPSGAVVGMDSMTMPFPLADEDLAAGYSPGDLVEMTIEVDWEAQPAVVVTALEPLPPGTELEMRRARPETQEPTAPEASDSNG